MNRIRIGDKEYYSIKQFMLLYGLRTRKSVYDWIAEKKVEKKKIGNNAFFSKL